MKVAMNVRIAGLSLIALAALTVGLTACGGGKSSTDKTKTAAAGTPASTASASKTAAKTASATGTSKTPAAGQTPGAAASPGAGSSPVADITVNADGTATNSQGTPVAVPTAGGAPANTPAPGTTPATGSTPAPGATTAPGATPAPGTTPVPGSGTRISIIAPATASGDFTATVRVDGVSGPYKGFNIAMTFDASIADFADAAGGNALAASPDEVFCAKLASSPGVVVFGCTILGETMSTNDGVLATFSFKRTGAGTLQLALLAAQGDPNNSTYLVVKDDENFKPLNVPLNNATVIVS
jgi:hypothetical protein